MKALASDTLLTKAVLEIYRKYQDCYRETTLLKENFRTGVCQGNLEKTPVLESLFNKYVGLKTWKLYLKETPTQVFQFEFCKVFRNSFPGEHVRGTTDDEGQVSLGEING